MKKLFLLTITAFFSLGLFAQQTLNEKFESETFPPPGWSMSHNYYNKYGGGKYIDWQNKYYNIDQHVACSKGSYANHTTALGNKAKGLWLITPQLQPNDGHNTITFKYKGYNNVNLDKIKVKVFDSKPDTEDLNAGTELLNVFPEEFTSYYQTATIDLSAYNDQKIYVAIINLSENMMSYIILDDFESEVPLFIPSNDIELTKIYNKSAMVGEHPIKVQIKNSGKNAITQCKINVNINGTDVLQKNWSGSLATYATEDVIIGNYNFANADNYIIKVNAEITNDDIADNNNLTTEIECMNPLTCPVKVNFEGKNTMVGWLYNNNDVSHYEILAYEKTQAFSGKYVLQAKYQHDTIFTRPINVNAGTEYNFSIWYIIPKDKTYKDITISYGKTQTDENLTEIVKIDNPEKKDTYTKISGNFTPSETGEITICINLGDKGAGSLTSPVIYFDDMYIKEANAPTTHTLTFSEVNNDGGTLAAKVDDNTVSTNSEIEEGKNIIFTATPNTDWEAKQWFVNNKKVKGHNENNFTLENISKDTDVKVEFMKYHKITIPTIENGNVKTSLDKAIAGTQIIIATNPDKNYQLKEGTLKVFKTGDESTTVEVTDLKFLMPEFPVTITAQYEPKPKYNITIKENPNGTVITDFTEAILGTIVQIKATPKEGYSLDPKSVIVYRTSDENTKVNVLNDVTFVMPAYDVTVSADFIGAERYAINITPPTNGTLSVEEKTAYEGKKVAIKINPAKGYQLKEGTLKVHKTDDATTEIAVNNNDNTFIMPAYPVTLSAEFEKVEYDITVVDVQNGKISTNVKKATKDTEVTITVEPNDEYKLKKGSLKVFKTGDEATTVKVIDNKFKMPNYPVTITAEFEAIEYNITVNNVEHGTLSAMAKAAKNTEVIITVTPEDGYRLIENSLKAHKTGDEATIVNVTDNKFTMPNYDVTITAEFEVIPPSEYAITIASIENGSLNAPSSATVGSEVTITVNANDGYKLIENSLKVHKTGDEATAVTVTDNKFTMPEFAVTVTAKFEKIEYDITVDNNVQNGKISTNVTKATKDTEVTITVEPKDEYKLKEGTLKVFKTGDESTIVNVIDNKFTMPTYAVTVTAEFEQIEYDITIDNVQNGTISSNVTKATKDTEVTITVEPNDGFQLKEGSLKVYETSNENNTVTVTDNKFTMPSYPVTITAEFEQTEYTITVENVNGGTIITTPEASTTEGTEVTITATAEQDYQLKEGSLNVYETGNVGNKVTITDNKFTMPKHDVTITAKFEQTYAIVVAVLTNGDLKPSAENAIEGTPITIEVTPDDGYQLLEGSLMYFKSDEPSVIKTINNNTFTMPNYAVSIMATFEPIPAPKYAITIDDVENGQLNTNIYDTEAEEGTEIDIIATPNDGYLLKEGSLKVYKTDEEATTVTITDNKFTMPAYPVTITAEFEVAPTEYEITVNDVENGTLNTSVYKAIEGTEVEITATANDGYKLKENSLKAYKTGDEATTVTITDNKFTMPAYPVTITAEFIEDIKTYIITFIVKDGANFIEDATISINNETLTSNTNGEAVIALNEGDYSYTVTKDGYESVTKQLNVTADANEEVNLTKTVGINEIETTYQVMPNPFTNKLVLKGIANAKEVNIYSVTGTLIYTNNNILSNELTINTNDFKQGVYFVKITNQQGKTSFEKVIKK